MKRYLPLIVIGLLMVAAYASGLSDLISFDNLRLYRAELVGFVDDHPFAAPLTYIGIYIVTIALSVPGAALLTMVGGFLFPQPFGVLYALVGATTGAVCIFLAAKTALGDFLKAGTGKMMKKMEAGFKDNMVSYLLFLRMVPAFPFWLVNLAPAFFGVPLRTYVWTTFVGIIPGTFVFSQAGSGIGSILDSGGEITLSTIFTTEIKIALLALGLFALAPIVIKKWRSQRQAG